MYQYEILFSVIFIIIAGLAILFIVLYFERDKKNKYEEDTQPIKVVKKSNPKPEPHPLASRYEYEFGGDNTWTFKKK